MNKKSSIGIAIILFLITEGFAQKLFHEKYDWGSPIIPNPEMSSNDKTVLFIKHVVEFAYVEESLTEYNLEHKIYLIRSEEEVNENNKIYLQFDQSSEIIQAKARVIKPDKKIVELDNSRVLESYDEESGHHYKYFALEGLEKDNIIELLYVIHKSPDYLGRRVFLQEKNPVNRFEFDLYSPENLIFEYLVRNDTNQVIHDTIPPLNHWTLYLDHVEGLEKEDDAPYNVLRKQLFYKLDRNPIARVRDISSYGNACQNIYENLYFSANKSDIKSLNRFISSMEIDENLPEDEKIFRVENHVKNMINILEISSPELQNISYMIENKMASKDGIMVLFVNIFKSMNIDHQVVVTSDRSEMAFDSKFESYNFLSNYLIYFPGTRKYMSPDDFESRYGMPTAEYTDNYGLYIKRVVAGGLESGIGKIKYIPSPDCKQSQLNHYVTATISNDFSTTELDVTTSSTGYFAAPLQPYLELLSEDVKKEIADNSLDNYLKNSKMNTWKFENIKPEVVGKLPFLINFQITNNDLIDMAGNRYLFKVGLLIGPQQELYSEKTRRLPVDDQFKRTFDRELTVQIPEGFKIINPEDLDILTEYVVEGNQLLKFESVHKIEGNLLKVKINEYYNQCLFTVDEYPYYRDVVNSASDFNKVVLVIEKE